MIYAIPNRDNTISNHFMKAPQFALLDSQSLTIDMVLNPADKPEASCHDKKSIITLIAEKKADAVVVRNIGERALGKLLSSGLRVFQIAQKTTLETVLSTPMAELTHSSQGRPSVNHQNKGGCCSGGCDCGNHSSDNKCSGSHPSMITLGDIKALQPIKKATKL